jgi:hypothetical protein
LLVIGRGARNAANNPYAHRLEALPDGRLAHRLKTRWRDGTTHVLMERHELLERLAPLIPPPRAHQVRYHGLLAPCASGRDRVVPRPLGLEEAEAVRPAAVEGGPTRLLEQVNRSEGESEPTPSMSESPERSLRTESPETPDLATERATTKATGTEAEPGRGGTPPTGPTRRTPWADLLQRVFEVDALHCPRCGGRMRVLAAITETDVAQRILACLNLPKRAPPLARSRPGGRTLAWPANEASRAGETDALWSTFEFDQSTPAE